MSNRAARRIKRRQRSKVPFSDVDMALLTERLRFFLIILVSLLLHGSILFFLNILPDIFPETKEELVVYSIETISLPGPMGGGGEAREVEKPKPEPEPEPVAEPEPEPEPEVPIPEPAVEPEPAKPEPEPKPAEKTETPKPAPKPAAQPKSEPTPAGPGVGPVGGGGEGGEEGPVTVSGGIPFPFPEYIKQVQRKTKQVWNRSRASYSTRRELMVEVTYRIHKGGSVSDARVTKSSRNSLVDRFALGVIKDSSPYDVLPEGYDGKFLEVVYRFTIEPNR